MKQFTLGILILMSFMPFACTEDPDELFEQEIEKFKLQTAPQFIGTVLDSELQWKYLGDFQENGINVSYSSCHIDADEPAMHEIRFSINHTFETSYIRSIAMVSPEFAGSSSIDQKKSIFNTGIKAFESELGLMEEGFEIIVCTADDEFLSTRFGDQETGSLEVIKSMEYKSGDETFLMVWMIINCDLYNQEGEMIGQITDGLILPHILL